MKRLAAVALVPLLAVGCGGGGASSVKDNGTVSTTGAAGAQTATVDMTDTLVFKPNIINAKVGTVTLLAKNVGLIPHNLVFDDSALGKTGTIDGKKSEPLKVVFDKAGTFTFVCTFHSGMTGKVVVS
ncbi:MAG: Cupredoxin-like domain [Frankiales bacterium]|jgi:plastocyanin|nr:Cupredoxin-like domain [Frankiales bacterium]